MRRQASARSDLRLAREQSRPGAGGGHARRSRSERRPPLLGATGAVDTARKRCGRNGGDAGRLSWRQPMASAVDRIASHPRRSCLSVPGHAVRMHEKAVGMPADEALSDLEDAVGATLRTNDESSPSGGRARPGGRRAEWCCCTSRPSTPRVRPCSTTSLPTAASGRERSRRGGRRGKAAAERAAERDVHELTPGHWPLDGLRREPAGDVVVRGSAVSADVVGGGRRQ
jgi:hypothetical protein